VIALATGVLFGALQHGPPVDVRRRGASCDDADLEARIAHYLQSSSAAGETAMTVDAELAREGSLWRLHLRVPADGSMRTFRAASCATVIDAAAFVVAVAIDPTVADAIEGPELGEPPESAEPEVGASTGEPDEGIVPPPEDRERGPADTADPPRSRDETPPREASRVPAPDRTPGSAPRAQPAIALGASGGIEGGSLPRVGGLVRVDLGALGRRWRADVRASVRTPSRARADADPDVGGSIGAWSIGARGCGLPRLRARGVDVPLCGGVEAGQVFAEGFGFGGARSARLPWAALTVGPALTWAVRPSLALVVTAEVGASLLGGELVIDGLGLVHRIGPVFGRGLVGLEGRFRGRSRRFRARSGA
jgi:hypothetical protein